MLKTDSEGNVLKNSENQVLHISCVCFTLYSPIIFVLFFMKDKISIENQQVINQFGGVGIPYSTRI
jgi:hypothetical protein